MKTEPKKVKPKTTFTTGRVTVSFGAPEPKPRKSKTDAKQSNGRW